MSPVGEIRVRAVRRHHQLRRVVRARTRARGLRIARGEPPAAGIVGADHDRVVDLVGEIGVPASRVEGEVPGPRARPGARPRDLGERAPGLVQAVGVDRVGAQIDGEDMTAVGARDDLVRVRPLLPRARRRTAVHHQIRALAQCARRLNRMHGDTSRAVVRAQQPPPARMHRQLAGCLAAAAPGAEDLTVGQSYGGHPALRPLVHGVQRSAVRVYGEVRRVADTGDRPLARDTATAGVVRRHTDTGAAPSAEVYVPM